MSARFADACFGGLTGWTGLVKPLDLGAEFLDGPIAL